MVATELVVHFNESNSLDLNNNLQVMDSTEKLAIPTGKKRHVKSPTPARALSATPTRRSRSKTPFNLYLSRRSADPNEPTKWRSITPFINRKDKELTPFELGKDLKSQLISHKMVFDKASVMDISESDFEPVRYISSDVSVIDRASVMDVSNIEVIYLVEEYDEDEIIEDEKPAEDAKKKKGKKGKKSKSIDKDDSPLGDKKIEVKSKKKAEKKKKDESKSPSLSPPPQVEPKLTLKLELGGGSKINKKLFENKSAVEQAKPPPKKNKLAMEIEQAKKTVQTANETTKKETEKYETEKENEYRSEDEVKDQEEIDDDNERDDDSTRGDENDNNYDTEHDDSERQSQSIRESFSQIEEDQQSIYSERIPSPVKKPTRSPSPKLLQVRPPAYWKKIAATEGEDFMDKMKYFYSVKREKPHYPAFINKLKDICSTETQTIRMVCAVYGPDLTIKWFKDDILMNNNDRYNFTENDEIISLEIYNCKPSDTADYSCTISNKYQKITSTCYVNVCEMGGHQDEPYPPTIEGFEDSYHYIDDKLIIQCKIKGIPRPNVTWSRNGNDIDIYQSKEYTLIEGAHGTYQLIINHPSSKDSGIYQVKATNSRGIQERNHCVEFLISNKIAKSRF